MISNQMPSLSYEAQLRELDFEELPSANWKDFTPILAPFSVPLFLVAKFKYQMRAKPHCSVLSLVFHIREEFDLSLPCYFIAYDVSIRGHMKRILEGTNLYFDVSEEMVEPLALPNSYPGHSQGDKYY